MMRRLRPHHGLCTLFFEGKGYSDAFVRHMTEVIEEAEQGERFCLTTAADEICTCCPRRQGDQCSGENARKYDRAVLSCTGYAEGDAVTLQELQAAAEEHILRPGLLETVCGGCGWADICQTKWKERNPTL